MANPTFEAVVATPREGKFNKNAARRVRVAGKIPAVVYGAGQDAVAVSVDPKVITRFCTPTPVTTPSSISTSKVLPSSRQ
jgi:ribosomal protein L25 (general stress protein Ctc)